MKYLIVLFMLFYTYSILGWVIEMFVTTIETKKVVNRGFLIGPYCPVYGVGSISILTVLGRYSNDFMAFFVMSVVICSLVEYFTSYIMEKMFNARWWDYSTIPFNVNGRICLINSILFGIGGLFLIKINPYIFNFYNGINSLHFAAIFGICFGSFVIDAIVSFNIINKLKLSSLEFKKDSTGEITEKVRKVLVSKSQEFKRLLFAFPNVKFNVKIPKKKNKN